MIDWQAELRRVRDASDELRKLVSAQNDWDNLAELARRCGIDPALVMTPRPVTAPAVSWRAIMAREIVARNVEDMDIQALWASYGAPVDPDGPLTPLPSSKPIVAMDERPYVPTRWMSE